MSCLAAIGDYRASAAAWMRMSARHQLARPQNHLGAAFTFRDGTTSRVFRETRVVGGATADPAVLVIRFRLAFLDDLEPLHAGFRYECLIHTPLFAGFRGFRSKLWLEDVRTRMYRGVYEWDGSLDADVYARRMVGLLTPFASDGSARYQVVPGLTRSGYLHNPEATVGGASDAWWRLAHRVDKEQPP